MLSALIALLILGLLAYLLFNKRWRTVVKTGERIAFNELDSFLKKMEDLEKSLNNSIKEKKDKYEEFKLECANIFKIGYDLNNSIREEEAIISGLNKEIEKCKQSYDNTKSDEMKEHIINLFTKTKNHEDRLLVLKNSLLSQIENDKKVEMSLLNFQKVIDSLELKAMQASNSYKTAKNKETILRMTSANDETCMYNMNDILKDMQNVINEIDGKEKVEEITGNDVMNQMNIQKLIDQDYADKKWKEMFDTKE